ncbi:MAG: hypothetical protein ACJ795_05185 [Ktedonobacteraceae bacterium]
MASTSPSDLLKLSIEQGRHAPRRPIPGPQRRVCEAEGQQDRVFG